MWFFLFLALVLDFLVLQDQQHAESQDLTAIELFRFPIILLYAVIITYCC